ncbi:MAG: ATP synthase F0 subunit C [Acidobacteria bacterium]|nr:ATP synthase F0 subunit C [Acidobacteriota bacterium]
MSRRLAIVGLVLVIIVLVAGPVLAAEGGAAPAPHQKNMWQFVGAAFAIAIAAAGGAIGDGRGMAAACDAMGRNPGGAGPIRITLIIGMALIESLVIYALIIAFMILSA